MKPIEPNVSFPELETKILNFWNENKLMEKSFTQHEGDKAFVFYDGPPFATGLPHYGHILAGSLKDIIPRYWSMKGFHVERRWGWDCHGLPVEFEMEKELGLQGKQDIEKLGVAKFNESCRTIVLRYTSEWEAIIKRTGRWVDFKNNYRTMDTPFMESVWWIFKELWNKGLIYEGYRVMPYSWRIATPLSNFEAGLNYKEVQDPAVTVKFKSDKNRFHYLAWTTTPWTLPSNMALSVHPELSYVEVLDKVTNEHYVLGKSALARVYKDVADYEITGEFLGKTFDGDTYTPLFSYFSAHKKNGAFKVVCADHVTDTDGTAIVHTAPAFGEVDYTVCMNHAIAVVNPVDDEGKFTAEVVGYAGVMVKDADKLIIRDLKASGQILRHETIMHNYPFCWRSDTPLIYRAISTWFVKLEPLKENLVKNNQQTHWVPEHLRDGRFGKWLEGARDWNISRNRYWGTPLPIWRCEKDKTHFVCIGSIAELKEKSGKEVSDLHKHFIDDITVKCTECGAEATRISEVLDCWFESGAMPYAQSHYPFENKEKFEKNFPADFIAEGIDQTRGWFYTLSVLSTALWNKPPFKNVVVNGMILAEDGKKMSKRLKNYPDPMYVMQTYGADAMRAYLMTSPASHAEDLRFSEAGVKEIVRSVILPYWNSYSFLVTYALADQWNETALEKIHQRLKNTSSKLDLWILSRLHTLISDVDTKMASYHLYEVLPLVLGFLDELTNWYIRLNRRRFWSEEKNDDKNSAYATLYYVLCEFTKVIAPVLPFVTEDIYQNLLGLNFKGDTSVHLTAFPKCQNEWIKKDLEQGMMLMQQVVEMGRSLRSSSKLKTRLPLSRLRVISRNDNEIATLRNHVAIIQSELNIKEIEFSSHEGDLVSYIAKPNAKILGPRLGARMKTYFQKIKELSTEKLEKLLIDKTLELDGELFSIDEIPVERTSKGSGVIATQGSTTVWLDTTLTSLLINEGMAREIVNRVQKLRKDRNLNVSDAIELTLECSEEFKVNMEPWVTYIQDETLAKCVHFGSVDSSLVEDVDGERIGIDLKK